MFLAMWLQVLTAERSLQDEKEGVKEEESVVVVVVAARKSLKRYEKESCWKRKEYENGKEA